MKRRNFLGASAAAALSAAVGTRGASTSSLTTGDPNRLIRIGIIGTGKRGRTLLHTLLQMENLAFPAFCDIDPDALQRVQKMAIEAGHPQPEGYSRGEEHFREMVTRDDLDLVIVATPWDWHTPMAVAAMKAGKTVGVEVPCAVTLEDCHELVKTSEETGVHCMMLENWSFRRDNLALLKMMRAGLFGTVVHGQCAYSHDCVGIQFFDKQGNDRWGAKFLEERNCALYPTHGLGPILSWMDINCGDRFKTLTATATRSRGINEYFLKTYGPDHPNVKRKFAQGDIVTAVVKTENENSIVVSCDLQLPRPYDNRWTIQGTKGIYNEQRDAIYLDGVSPRPHQWEPFAPYQDRYDHAWWKNAPEDIHKQGHGGCDYMEFSQLFKSMRLGTPPPIDIYDSVTMSVVVPLSEKSIAMGGAPVECPDFTHGAWKTRKPTFAVEA